jgi:hypothetical protein
MGKRLENRGVHVSSGEKECEKIGLSQTGGDSHGKESGTETSPPDGQSGAIDR